jgi:hypothetical protein
MDATLDQNILTKLRLCTSSSRCCCHRWLGGVWEEGAGGGGGLGVVFCGGIGRGGGEGLSQLRFAMITICTNDEINMTPSCHQQLLR